MKLSTMNSKSTFFEPTNHHEIENIICNMEKNGGNDNINAKRLKTFVEYLVDPLTHIYNLCIDKAADFKARCLEISRSYTYS